jgi:methyl-accepting chemotaxis protein
MIKTLLAYYDKQLPANLKVKFEEDFLKADKIVLFITFGYFAIVTFLTSMQYGHYTLGLVGGGIISAIALIAYKTLGGTPLSRIIMSLGLTGMMAITIQQSHGLGEGHFLLFLNFAIIIRYKDFVPVLILVGAAVVHHLLISYCQVNGIDIFGQPAAIFSWGEDSSLGIFAPLLYHIVIAILAFAISTYYVLEGNVKFIEANKVIGAIEQMVKGDLTTRIDNQEKSSLLAAINNFVAHLHTTMQGLTHVTQSLNKQSEGALQSAHNQQLKAHEQQSEVTLVATSVQEMTMATQEIARNAEHTANTVNDVAQATDKGQQLSETFRRSVDAISDKVKAASATLTDLEQNMGQIDTIVATIRSISEQTNLLALNAAIEAARAGEQGRGFAVVADEVRVLSKRTHDSTEEISEMINSFHQSTSASVSTMTECEHLAEQNEDNSRRFADNFEHIARDIVVIQEVSTQIATAAEEQTVVTEEISKNVEAISEVADLFHSDVKASVEDARHLKTMSEEVTKGVSGYTV